VSGNNGGGLYLKSMLRRIMYHEYPTNSKVQVIRKAVPNQELCEVVEPSQLQPWSCVAMRPCRFTKARWPSLMR